MDALCIVVGVVLGLVQQTVSQTGPTHCTYADEVYTCDYRAMTSSDRPIDFYQFSVQPQQLILQVDGLLPYYGDSITFTTGFSTSFGMDPSLFNDNYPASLTLDCGTQGSIYIYTSAFYFMEYVEYVKIRNCDTLYIGEDVFASFTELDGITFEGGTIDLIEISTMSGLTLQKMNSSTHTFPRKHGKLEVINTQFVYGIITPWLLTFFTKASSIVLKNNGITFVSEGQFMTNLGVKTLDLSDNLFYTLPDDVFSYPHGLSQVRLFNIPWECKCDDLKWLNTVIKNNITIMGDLMCADKNGVSLWKFYYDNCLNVGPCHGATGVVVGDKCLSSLGIVAITMGCMAFVGTCAALVIAIIIYKDIDNDPDPVLLERLKRKAKQRWIYATRTIIYAKRTGRPLAAFESKSSIKTMSIPDETRTRCGANSRTTFDSSIPDFNSLNGTRSSPGLSDSPDSYGRMHRVHSLSDASYADFPIDNDNVYRR